MFSIETLRTLVTWLRERPMFSKIAIVLLCDFVALMSMVFLAYILRISAIDFPPRDSIFLYVIAPFLSIASIALMRVYGAASRNYSSHIEWKLVVSQLLVPPAWALVLVYFGTNGFARSVIGIYFILAIFALASIRRLAANVFGSSKQITPKKERIPVLIYGAGREGALLIDNLNRNGRYRALAFIDTDYTLIGRSVNGISVYATESLSEVIQRLRPQEVLIAKPQQNRATRRALLDMFLSMGLKVKVVPGIEEIVDGNIDLTALRPIRLEDLLGRDPVPPDRQLMEAAVRGHVVMVTGAGGSIGSELVRQTANYQPRKIVLVENNEFSLFEIHRELERKIAEQKLGFSVVPLLVDIRDEAAMITLLKQNHVDVIFHAAAYKHVRMVQENMAAGIWNNVWGTKTLADCAKAAGVERFVMVSTDKAVRPTSVMGASKRVAEMYIQALAREKKNKTVFSMVRFGNVLGSTGSVVPLFRQQIEKGGPVSVTHPDVTRYFMLIPEAAQLVIQAGSMAVSGEVFVLDMGESVKIVRLAETMIELAGMTRKTPENPDGEIEIEYTGLRDGEKLFEELQIGRDVSNTQNPRIMRSNEFFLPLSKIASSLAQMEKFMRGGETRKAVDLLMQLAHLGS